MFCLFSLKKIWISLLFIFLITTAKGETTEQVNVSVQLKSATEAHILHFPLLTNKIYLQRFHQSIWFNSDLNPRLLKEATDLIYSAAQFGLNRMDFHCEQISEKNISNIVQNNLVDGFKPMLDILLTDAMLTFIAQLHYGKVNEKYPLKDMDQEQFKGMKIDSILLSALNEGDFTKAIKSVEPKFKGYKDLQQQMSLIATPFKTDCDWIKDENFMLLAINLERWRWLNKTIEPYAFINIPAFTLTYFRQNTAEEFKVIIGKPSTKTPVLTSKIRFFTTAPSWVVPKSIIRKEIIPKTLKDGSYLYDNHLKLYDDNGNEISSSISNLVTAGNSSSGYSLVQSPGISNALGQIKFNFDNSFSVYLHDTPNRSLFNQTNRALSHGCIRVENPEKLVHLFLEDAEKANVLPEVLAAMSQYKRKVVYLPNPIFITVAYFTVEVKNGVLLTYKDLYAKDKALSNALQQTVKNL